MMAAMAQQDCGQCGYNCKDYADALFGKKEERLNLCVPGGKNTARILKKLYEEFEKAPATSQANAIPAAAPLSAPGSLTRQSGPCDLPVTPPPQQRGFGKRNLASRIRSR